ncbi:MAG: type I-C CRISPR-associated protein Cas7/Csd2 [Thermacetogeniaceae bacterium]|jgi:CRISPR-associated protein Csd2
MTINNRYEFMYFVECKNGNPNGDPDMGNSPRMDPQDMRGLISDVAIKRRIRNYIQFARGNQEPYGIIIQQNTNINKFIAKAHEETGNTKMEKTKDKVAQSQKWLCNNFYDVRTFGAVLSTGPNAGQVRGPVQLTFLRSYDPILPLDISITRMSVAEPVGKKGVASYEEYEAWEEKQPEDELRTMGRKQLIPYGLYEGRGFISAHLAERTEFGDEDLKLLWEALLNMYEHDRSASKGEMSTVLPLIIFKHIGTDSDEGQRINQAKLGCAPAHQLFDLVRVDKKADVDVPRDYCDYNLQVNLDQIPNGVEIGFALPSPEGVHITWGAAPDNLPWVKVKS